MKGFLLCLGLSALPSVALRAQGTGCGNGSTTTLYAQNNGFAGNMMDIEAGGFDFALACIDVNCTSAPGTQVEIEIWVVPDSCVGRDTGDLCTSGWTRIAIGNGISAGTNLPTPVLLTPIGLPFVFQANARYGLYLNFANYGTSQCGYSNSAGPIRYFGSHCDLITYYGKNAFSPPCTAGDTFAYCEFNGTLHTEWTGPVLSLVGSCPGVMSLDFRNCSRNSNLAVLFGAAGSFIRARNPCAGLVLDLRNPTLGTMIRTDGVGGAQLSFNAPVGACGRSAQGVDVARCAATNPVQL